MSNAPKTAASVSTREGMEHAARIIADALGFEFEMADDSTFAPRATLSGQREGTTVRFSMRASNPSLMTETRAALTMLTDHLPKAVAGQEWTFYHRLPAPSEITVNTTRSPEALAKDITRRLLVGAVENYREITDRVMRTNAIHAAKSAATDTVVDTLVAFGRQVHRQEHSVTTRIGHTHGYVDIQVEHGRIEIAALTSKQMQAVVAALASIDIDT